LVGLLTSPNIEEMQSEQLLHLDSTDTVEPHPFSEKSDHDVGVSIETVQYFLNVLSGSDESGLTSSCDTISSLSSGGGSSDERSVGSNNKNEKDVDFDNYDEAASRVRKRSFVGSDEFTA
jgi:hypothetical protein